MIIYYFNTGCCSNLSGIVLYVKFIMLKVRICLFVVYVVRPKFIMYLEICLHFLTHILV